MIREQINALPVGSGSGSGNDSRDLSFLNREEEFGHLIMVGKWPLPLIVVGKWPLPFIVVGKWPLPLLWLVSGLSPLIMITQ